MSGGMKSVIEASYPAQSPSKNRNNDRDKKRVLFLCTGILPAAKSLKADEVGGGRAVRSKECGILLSDVHPLAIQVIG